MNRNKIIPCALAAAVTLAGCTGFSDTQQRTATGAAIGGAALGIATGDWGWAAAGAAAGAAGGFLVDQSKKNEEKAFQRGLQQGQSTRSN
jgi:hypothetical protein